MILRKFVPYMIAGLSLLATPNCKDQEASADVTKTCSIPEKELGVPESVCEYRKLLDRSPNTTVILAELGRNMGIYIQTHNSGSKIDQFAKVHLDLNPEEIGDTHEQFKHELRRIMGILTEREIIIISDYFGLSGTPRTLSDIGEDFNLTKERVRQIKEKALRKLRNESRILLDYIQ